MYYMAEFGSLKRKEGDFASDFSKRFNKMYNKIPAEIKPSEASAKITYASAFDLDFCLLLRERRATTLANMQDASLEVESNVLAFNRLEENLIETREEGDMRPNKVEELTMVPVRWRRYADIQKYHKLLITEQLHRYAKRPQEHR
jgi:hypothetical protein